MLAQYLFHNFIAIFIFYGSEAWTEGFSADDVPLNYLTHLAPAVFLIFVLLGRVLMLVQAAPELKIVVRTVDLS